LKTNYGGICVFIKCDLQVSVVDLPSYKSFELVSLHVRFGHLSCVFIVAHQQHHLMKPFSLTSPMSLSALCRSPDVWLSATSTFTWMTCLVLTPLDSSHCLRDSVCRPTGKNPDHQSDVFFTRSDLPAAVIRVDPPLISDHSFIVAHLSEMATGPMSNTLIRRRQWRSFVFDAFIEDLKQSRLVVDLRPTSLSCSTVTTPLSPSYWTNMRRGPSVCTVVRRPVSFCKTDYETT
jgi:hypothetical protein